MWRLLTQAGWVISALALHISNRLIALQFIEERREWVDESEETFHSQRVVAFDVAIF